MKISPSFKNQCYILFFGIIAISLSYLYVDKETVYQLWYYDTRESAYLQGFALISDLIPFFIFLIIPVIWIRFHFKKNTYDDKAFLVIALSAVITIFLKNALKFVFARYWPETWVNDNVSFLNNGVYGFEWFKFGTAYQSFPSGHMALITAVMVAIILVYPRLKWLALLMISLMAIGQIGCYFHFVSDVAAGGLLGYLVARNVVEMSSIKPMKLKKAKKKKAAK